MFDLFRSRDKAVRYVLGGMLMLVALSMVVTLIPGFGSATRADDPVVAEVGKEAITIREVQTELQSLVRNRQIPAEMLQVYAPQFIDQMIQDRAVSYEAARMGFQVSDTELANTIRNILPRFFNNGQLIDKAAYENFIAERGMSIPEFEATVRKQMLLSRLQNIAMEGVVVTPQEIQQQFEKTKQKIKIEYLSFKGDDLKAAVKVTPEDLQKYYDANKNGYMEQERRNLALLIADQEKIAAAINVSDAQLRQAYDSHRDQYRTPERVRVRHILLKTTEKPPAEVANIKKKSEDLLKQLKTGADFADLAKKNSEDAADKGGELGWIVRGQTVKNFEAAAFSLKPGQLSDVVSTEYGFHILQVEEKQEAHTQSFDEVKGQLEAEMKKQVVFERMQMAADQARAALVKAPGDIDRIASQYNLEVVRVDKAGAGQVYPQVGSVPDLDVSMAGAKKGDVTPVFQAPGDKLVFADVLDAFPPHVQAFVEVESRVRDTVVKQKAQGLAAERANQAISRLRAGEDLAKVAKDLGAEVKTSNEFTINDAVEGVGAANLFSEGFAKPVGTVIGPTSAANDSTVVSKVVAKVPADLSLLPANRESIVQDLKQKKQQERRDLFYDSILSQLIKDGKVKKHPETIKRLVASYRS
jgi:peptidyl-prolyl cis-trans isomerase D